MNTRILSIIALFKLLGLSISMVTSIIWNHSDILLSDYKYLKLLFMNGSIQNSSISLYDQINSSKYEPTSSLGSNINLSGMFNTWTCTYYNTSDQIVTYITDSNSTSLSHSKCLSPIRLINDYIQATIHFNFKQIRVPILHSLH